MTPPALDERLPAPKLDDRRFQDLVDEAKRRVQQRCPEWTDHNVSDPGVTLIEAFAWMTDQLLYRLNRVPDLNYIKFLELIGVRLFPPTAARVDVTFRLSKPAEVSLPIPAETQVSTPRSASGEQITFATAKPLIILPCRQQSLASVDHLGVEVNHEDTDRVVCFTDRPRPGDALLIGLDRPVPSCTVRLFLACKSGLGGGISPDNPPLVWDARVGENGGTVTLWDTHSRDELGRFTSYEGQAVRCVAFSPDTHKLASAGDGPVWLRDVHEPDRSGKRLDGHEGTVRALAFSTDGRRLASGGDDGSVRLWDVHATNTPALRLDGHVGPVFAVAFDQAGTTLASAGADGTVRLWTVENGEAGRVWDVHEQLDASDPKAPGHRRCVLGVSFLEDEQRLAAAADDGTLWLWDLEEQEQPAGEEAGPERRLVGHRGPVFGVAFSPSGKTLATAGADGTVRLWAVDPKGQTEAGANDLNGASGFNARLEGHQGPVYNVAFSRDGKTIATVGSDWTARLWSTAGIQIRRPLSDRSPVHAVAFHPTGDMVATAGLDGAWAPCEVEADNTQGLNRPEHVILHVPAGHMNTQIAEQTAAWLRCRVRAVEKGQKPYDKSPELSGVVVAETIGGTVEALNIEVVHNEALGVSEGVAGQRFPVERRPVVPLPGNERHVLLVGEGDYPEAWEEVQTFAKADEHSKQFVLDYVAGEVRLGPEVRERTANGREKLSSYGAVPPKGALLRLQRYMTGGGRRGNVAERKLTVLRTPIANVAAVVNRRAASGGVDGEDIENAKLRGPITLRTADRAVTPEDFEQLAREAAPELARVECIPATDEEDSDEPHEGEARVLVIPSVEAENGRIRFEQLVPPVEMMNRIRSYLDRRRVIGVRVLVSPPKYHGITIAAKLVSRPEFDPAEVKERALTALYQTFNPLSGGREGNGWEFGRPVLQGDVYAVLQSVAGVDRVEDCRLFDANPLTGERTPIVSRNGGPGEYAQKIEVSVSRYATVFSYRHYVAVEER